jgi:hypothetical protein
VETPGSGKSDAFKMMGRLGVVMLPISTNFISSEEANLSRTGTMSVGVAKKKMRFIILPSGSNEARHLGTLLGFWQPPLLPQELA